MRITSRTSLRALAKQSRWHLVEPAGLLRSAYGRPRNDGTQGFTFIELILTISVLGFLAVAALPTDQNTVPIALEAASRKVKSDIRYAQNLATTTGDPHGFRATGANTYEIYNVTTGAIVSSPLTNLPMQENLSTNYEATSFGAQNYQIEFDRFGRPTMGGGTIIQLNYNNDFRQIQVTNTSGYVGFL